MAFDVREFLSNLSDPGLRATLDAQREQERERAKEIDKNIAYVDAAGIMSKDAAKDLSGSELRRLVERDTATRRIGMETLQQEAYRQQIAAQKRRAATEAAVAQAFDYMRQQQQRGNIPDDAPAGMMLPGDGNILTDPGVMMAPRRSGDAGDGIAPDGSAPVNPMDRQERVFDAFTRYPAAFNSELGRDIAMRGGDPFRARKLAVEEGQLKVNEKELELRAKGTGKVYADLPSLEEQARLWEAGRMVVQKDTGGWETVPVETEKKMDTATLLAVLTSGGDLKQLLADKKSNPFRPLVKTGTAGGGPNAATLPRGTRLTREQAAALVEEAGSKAAAIRLARERGYIIDK